MKATKMKTKKKMMKERKIKKTMKMMSTTGVRSAFLLMMASVAPIVGANAAGVGPKRTA